MVREGFSEVLSRPTQRSGQRGPGDNQGQADMRPGPQGLYRGCQAP